MMSLSGLCVGLGVVYIVLHLPLVVLPAGTRRVLLSFPRNRWAGGILAALALAWSAWGVNEMPLGMIDAYKGWLWVLGPVVYILVMMFMNELLAARALGGILMLCASPVLEIQRLNASYWTWVVAGLAYAWVVAGMVLVLSPYRFRHAVERCCGSDGLCRLAGAGGVLMGGLLLGLGKLVF